MNRNAIVTGLLLLVVFVIGFGLGRMTAGPGTASVTGGNGFDQIGDSFDRNDSNTTATQANGTGTTINTSNLTDGQRKMLEALGIDANSVTITPEMVACAEAKLGAARIEEIKNGATPSFSEGASLMACYR